MEIKNKQTQSAPNNFDHAGESGDCGIATATKMGNDYKFTLEHKLLTSVLSLVQVMLM